MHAVISGSGFRFQALVVDAITDVLVVSTGRERHDTCMARGAEFGKEKMHLRGCKFGFQQLVGCAQISTNKSAKNVRHVECKEITSLKWPRWLLWYCASIPSCSEFQFVFLNTIYHIHLGQSKWGVHDASIADQNIQGRASVGRHKRRNGLKILASFTRNGWKYTYTRGTSCSHLNP